MENPSNITFVSSFLNIYNDIPYEHKNIDWYTERFEEIASSGIQIALYTSSCYENQMKTLAEKYPNVKLIQTIELKDTQFYKMCDLHPDITMPETRYEKKDTKEYMLLMHSKIEFMNDTIEKNPWNSSYFAWIDFSISHIFTEKEYSKKHLNDISKMKFSNSPFLYIPGCWNKIDANDSEYYLNRICWRFCGGFFIGDAKSISDFYQLYLIFFPIFLNNTKKMVWEVNFWAWLETNQNWKPRWFLADHNDSMIKIPIHYSYIRLFDISDKIIQYNYPLIDNFSPGSASYLYFQGKHLLNTRYINYEIQPQGFYLYKNGKSFIENFNLFSELDNNLSPKFLLKMNDNIDLPSNANSFSFGLEDIRLFEYNNCVFFIATNVNYSPTGTNRIIIGKYNINDQTYSDCRILNSPYNATYEKNWIPIVLHQLSFNVPQKGAEMNELERLLCASSMQKGVNEDLFFIYKWYPMEIGKINPDNNTLEIIKKIENLPVIFQRIRGSSTFVPDPEEDGNLVGIVHFSEDTTPRRYFNMLVLLDKTNLQPLKYTEIFYFENIGVEFSIGFAIIDGCYKFWISRMDINPLLVSVPKEKIPFTNVLCE